MTRRTAVVAFLLGFCILGFSPTPFPDDKDEPEIVSVLADRSVDQVVIDGTGSCAVGEVTLGGQALPIVTGAGGSWPIVAQLPPTVIEGDYLLAVECEHLRGRRDKRDKNRLTWQLTIPKATPTAGGATVLGRPPDFDTGWFVPPPLNDPRCFSIVDLDPEETGGVMRLEHGLNQPRENLVIRSFEKWIYTWIPLAPSWSGKLEVDGGFGGGTFFDDDPNGVWVSACGDDGPLVTMPELVRYQIWVIGR